MKLITEFAAGSRSGNRCLEPLPISEIVERMKTNAYAIGATDVRNYTQHLNWIMKMSMDEYEAWAIEQSWLHTMHHKRTIENLQAEDLLPWEIEYEPEPRVHYPDMDYEGEGYREPNWDEPVYSADDNVTYPAYTVEQQIENGKWFKSYMQQLDETDDELPF